MPGSFIIGIVSAVVLAVLLGGVLLAVGWRGRRVGRHPVCARCGFELSGIPVTPEAGRPPCPECGCALDDPKSIATGSRRRRPVVALVGALLLVAGLSVGGGVAALASGSPAFMPYKPVALLAWELEQGSGATVDELAVEFERRRVAGLLTQADEARLIDAALDLQADQTRGWSFALGDFVESSTHTTPAQQARFESQMIVWGVEVRSRVRRGGPIPVLITTEDARSPSSIHGSRAVVLRNIRVNGIPADVIDEFPVRSNDDGLVAMNTSFSMTNGNMGRSSVGMYLLVPEEIEPGPIRVSFDLADPDGNKWLSAFYGRGPNTPEPPPLLWRGEFSRGAVMSEDERTVSVAPGEDREMKLSKLTQHLSGNGATQHLMITMGTTPEGVELAHHAVVLTPEGEEIGLGFVTSVRGGSWPPYRAAADRVAWRNHPMTFRIGPRHSSGCGFQDGSLFPEGSTLLLRPDPKYAEWLIDPVNLIDGEIDCGEILLKP